MEELGLAAVLRNFNLEQRVNKCQRPSAPGGPPFCRVISKRRDQPVIQSGRKGEEAPMLVVDSSKEGYRLRGSFNSSVQNRRTYPR